MDNQTAISPEGEALWPQLNSPDTKYSSAGLYRVKLKVKKAKALPLVAEIDARIKEVFEAAQARAKSPALAELVKQADAPYAECDEGEAVVFSFKLKASGVSRGGKAYKNRPSIYDMDGKPKRATIGHGSIIRVSFEQQPFHTRLVGAGVTLKLIAVQVIKLVDPTKPDAASFGFVPEPQPFGAAR